MLDKLGYYHGAAIVSLMEDQRCLSVRKRKYLGYVVNENSFVFLKYTARARSPWGFTFDREEVDRCFRMAGEYKNIFVGLICGGDGVCAIDWIDAKNLLGGKPGRIAVGRKHDQSYSVWGTAGELKRKISVNRWPSLLFE